MGEDPGGISIQARKTQFERDPEAKDEAREEKAHRDVAEPGFRSLLDRLLCLTEGALAVLTTLSISTDPRGSVSGVFSQVGGSHRGVAGPGFRSLIDGL